MNNKQLIKVIRTLVEVETAKQQERFLSKTFPRILEEEVSRRLAEVKGGVAVPSTQVVSEEIDPFQQVELALNKLRSSISGAEAPGGVMKGVESQGDVIGDPTIVAAFSKAEVLLTKLESLLSSA